MAQRVPSLPELEESEPWSIALDVDCSANRRTSSSITACVKVRR